jgi:3-oxoadipate enol-lactonase
METVSHDGHETAFRAVGTDGPGPAICYVHGSGGTHHVWARQYGGSAPVRPAVALDLSGHGESTDVDSEPGSGTLAAYADDVVAVARATDASVLVGNSLGGAVVQHVLLERDLDVEGAVLQGSGAKLGVAGDLREWLASDFDRAVDFLHGEDLLFHDPDPAVEERSREAMRAVGRAVTERDFLTCHRFDVRDRLDEIDVPVLALVGEHDRLTPPAYHEFFGDHIPSCRVRTVSDAAHLAMIERPAAVNDAIGAFVDDLDVD